MIEASLISEMDSLLLGEENDDIAEEGGDCGEGSAAIGHRNTRGKGISSCGTAPCYSVLLLCVQLGTGTSQQQ